MKVFVYYNLHRKIWSIKALEGPRKGRVIQHSRYIVLTDVKGKVSEAGRQRVLREDRKNVHAGLVGDWTGLGNHAHLNKDSRPVTYNPRKYSTVVYADDETPFDGAGIAVLAGRNVWVNP